MFVNIKMFGFITLTYVALPLVVLGTHSHSRIVDVLKRCGQIVPLKEHQIVLGFYCKRSIDKVCDVTVVSAYNEGKFAVRLLKTNLDQKKCKWMEIIDAGSGKDLIKGNKCVSNRKSVISTSKKLTFRFNFTSEEFQRISKGQKLHWKTLVTEYTKSNNKKCKKRSVFVWRQKRGGMYKKKWDNDVDDDLFLCDKNRCLSEELRCNYVYNCDDLSDERHCRGRGRMLCVLIGGVVVAIVIVAIFAFCICRKMRGEQGRVMVTPEDETEKNGEVITYILPTDPEKPTIDPIFCVEAGAVGGENVPVALAEAWAQKPPEYPGLDESQAEKFDTFAPPAPLAEGQGTVPGTPPPEYRQNTADSDKKEVSE